MSKIIYDLPIENAVVVDFKTGKTRAGKCNISAETIDKASSILANILLNHARNGGDMENLTPKSVFGKKEKK